MKTIIFQADSFHHLSATFKPLPIDAVYVYGSRAGGSGDRLSDYDFGILFAKNVPRKRKGDFVLELFSTLAKKLEVSEDAIDVVDAEAVSVLLQFNIICGRTIYIRSHARHVAFEAQVMARYHDEHYYYERYLRQTLAKIRKGVYFERRISYA